MDSDVLIVGAGPAGLVLAAELARYGLKPRIIDQSGARSAHSRALFLWPRTLELLDRGGMSAALLQAGHKILAANIHSGARRLGRIDFTGVTSPHPYALMLAQSEIEARLEAHLAGLGIQVERGVELVSFGEDAGGVSAILRLADTSLTTVSAKWLIGCDGASSTVRALLGIESAAPARPSNWVLADIALAGLDAPENELTSFWHEEGFLAIFPIAPGRARVIADVEPHAFALAEPTLYDVQEILDRRGPGGLRAADASWITRFHVAERNVAAYRAGHVCLAGDAAHLHNPVGAQGMNMGIHDAVNLGWKLALIHRHLGDPETLLASYHVERHGVAEAVIATIGRVTAVSLLKAPVLRTARNLFGAMLFGLAPARAAVAESIAEISPGYRRSPLNGPHDNALPGPHIGERMPPTPAETPPGAQTPRFALYAEPGDAVEDLLAEYPELVEPALRRPPFRRCVWLVRPDGYVAAAALEKDIGTVVDYLDKFAALEGRIATLMD